MFWLKIITKFIKALRAGDPPAQIAGGFSLGYLIGLMPFWTLQDVVILLVLVFANVNLSAGFLAMILAGLIAFLLDPVFHHLGLLLLTGIPALQGLWETLYNLPVAPLSRFNNTVVLGSLAIGLLTVWPVYLGMKKLVLAYRAGLEARVKKWKIVQLLKGNTVVRWFLKIWNLGGE